ncbi:MAG: uracil-DNA glycosylase [Bacilli bacterium]
MLQFKKVKHMDWSTFFINIRNKPYAEKLHKFLDEEYHEHICYPPRAQMFNAFTLTSYDSIKVVIIGQDPYHNEKQAMGLAFSVPNGIPLPPSLKNIYREITNDFGCEMTDNGDLTYLAEQGVLLLNARLSVRAHTPLSHDIPEYEQFLIDVLKFLDQNPQPIVFLLWGGFARNLKKHITNPARIILESVHPSPLSANRGGWFNQHQFKQTNDYLIKNGRSPINWQNH